MLTHQTDPRCSFSRLSATGNTKNSVLSPFYNVLHDVPWVVEETLGAVKMAQRVKGLAAMTDNLSSISRTYTVEREN